MDDPLAGGLTPPPFPQQLVIDGIALESEASALVERALARKLFKETKTTDDRIAIIAIVTKISIRVKASLLFGNRFLLINFIYIMD
jgi:hypothetical protein